MRDTAPTVELNDGSTMPQLGLGVFRMTDDEAETATTSSLDAGYQLVDTAAGYGNESGVGRAVARADRGQVFLTTKLTNDDHGYDNALRAFDSSAAKLGVEVLDLYLIHWPCPAQDRYVETWRALVQLQKDGRAASIGVSNFQPEHLRRIIDSTGVVPAVNQVELHPFLPQTAERAFMRRHGIVTEAWSPLGAGNGLLEHPVLRDLAARHGATPAQIVLAWNLTIGNVVIPKSSNAARMAENLASRHVTLTDDDLAAILGLDDGTRYGPHPSQFS